MTETYSVTTAFDLSGEKSEKSPAAARALGDQPVGLRVARVHDVEVGVLPIAPRGRVADELAVLAPCARLVAALAVRQQRQAAVGERVELVELAAAHVLRDQDHVARARSVARELDAILLEAELRARAARLRHPMHLVGVAEARGDQHRAVDGMPAEEGRRAELHVGPGPRGELGGHFGNAVSDQRRRLFDRLRPGRRCEADTQQGQCEQRECLSGGHATIPG